MIMITLIIMRHGIVIPNLFQFLEGSGKCYVKRQGKSG